MSKNHLKYSEITKTYFVKCSDVFNAQGRHVVAAEIEQELPPPQVQLVTRRVHVDRPRHVVCRELPLLHSRVSFCPAQVRPAYKRARVCHVCHVCYCGVG